VKLNARDWEAGSQADTVICVHGLSQHGGIFEGLGSRLAREGYRVMAVDLRGHGRSGHVPPWNTDTHVEDLLETADALGIERPAWIGHSFGGRMIAALAARAPERVDRLVLLDPGLEVPADYALKSAEMDRLDWSFASVEGATNALLSSDSMVAAPKEVVTAYVAFGSATARAPSSPRGASLRCRRRRSPRSRRCSSGLSPRRSTAAPTTAATARRSDRC
jgi:pimeloyl-ACP methyl ester carboxylesterase